MHNDDGTDRRARDDVPDTRHSLPPGGDYRRWPLGLGAGALILTGSLLSLSGLGGSLLTFFEGVVVLTIGAFLAVELLRTTLVRPRR